MLYFPFLLFTSTREVADMAVWWTAAPDIGPAHHASICSTFLSFPFLLFPFVSFMSTREVADMAMWWTAAPDIGPAHHASTCSILLSFCL